MRKIIILFIVLSSTLLFSQAYATDYYVRSSGTNGNGLTYATAWLGFSNINWSLVDSGNGILYVDGVYTTALTVGAAGESGTPIYIKGYTSSASVRGVQINNQDYVTIDGLIVENRVGATNIQVDGDSDNVTIKNCIIRGSSGGGRYSGIRGYDSAKGIQNLLIDNCTIYNNEGNGIYFWGDTLYVTNSNIYGNGQIDPLDHGIYIGEGTHSYVYNNTIHDQAHGSGVQFKGGGDIYYNVIYGNNLSGIQIGETYGFTNTYNIYNNVIYSNGGSAIAFYSSISGITTANIYNNSTYNNGYLELLMEENLSSLNVHNNIFYSNGSNPSVNATSQSNATWDYNIIWGTGAQSTYQGTHGAYINPQYVNPPNDMTLQSTSPGIAMNAGANASGGGSPPPPPPPAGLVPSPPTIMGVQ